MHYKLHKERISLPQLFIIKTQSRPRISLVVQQIRQAIPNNLKNLLADTFLAACKPIPEDFLYTSTSEQQNPCFTKAISLGLAELVLQNGEMATFGANKPPPSTHFQIHTSRAKHTKPSRSILELQQNLRKEKVQSFQ